MDRTFEDEWYNEPPTESEIREIIRNKKNGKATTDLKNEMMKATEVEFMKILSASLRLVVCSKVLKCDT